MKTTVKQRKEKCNYNIPCTLVECCGTCADVYHNYNGYYCTKMDFTVTKKMLHGKCDKWKVNK
jgi:hypothetical protein